MQWSIRVVDEFLQVSVYNLQLIGVSVSDGHSSYIGTLLFVNAPIFPIRNHRDIPPQGKND